ncbi:hypothetical protein J3R83DRAFT_12852 [Lanmaoa asiatica]|nr:hypothetical protein J3R83DRAFT_12852 [Lanmaoa asiatica]
MFSVLSFLALFSAALAVPFPFKWISWNAQSPLQPSNFRVEPPKDEIGWADPRTLGGRFIDFTTPRYGEPLNVIISNLSDPFVLTDEGFRWYYKSIGFSEECFGLHYGHVHKADLGDGDGRKSEHILARGNHFRAWKQNGTEVNTGAWFLGVSKEQDSTKHHMIVPNGYNIGRDLLVQSAVSGSSWKGISWVTDVEWREGLVEPGFEGINHAIAQDGRIAVLTVHRV